MPLTVSVSYAHNGTAQRVDTVGRVFHNYASGVTGVASLDAALDALQIRGHFESINHWLGYDYQVQAWVAVTISE